MKYIKWGAITAVLGCLGSLIVIVAAGAKIDCRWNQSLAVTEIRKDLDLVAMRLEQSIQNDQVVNLENKADRMQDRMWELEYRFSDSNGVMPPEILQEYRKLERDREKVLHEKQILEQKIREKNGDVQ
jgi:hypothetical protein